MEKRKKKKKMVKDAMNNEVSCLDAIEMRYLTNEREHKDLSDDDSYEIFCACRAFVADTARGNRKERISNATRRYIKPCGILRRLMYDTETGDVNYCCGQEWYSEMATLRDVFDV